MKKNIFVLSAIAVAMGVAAANVWQLQDNKTGAVLRLANIKALSDGNESGDKEEEEWGCGGNVTFIPNETLGSEKCSVLGQGLLGSHLVCKYREHVCCDPSKQTDCEGALNKSAKSYMKDF